MSEAKPEPPDLVKELDVPARFEIAKDRALAAKQVAETTHYFFTEKPRAPCR